MKLEFEIVGTHEGDNHALPKIKLTKAQQWTDKAQRYAGWKRHVQAAFFEAAKRNKIEQSVVERLVQFCFYPPEITGKMPIMLQPEVYARMDINIGFKNRKHADPENIFGSIADALFYNDVRLRGSFDFTENEPKAKVKVSITLADEKEMNEKNQKSGTI